MQSSSLCCILHCGNSGHLQASYSLRPPLLMLISRHLPSQAVLHPFPRRSVPCLMLLSSAWSPGSFRWVTQPASTSSTSLTGPRPRALLKCHWVSNRLLNIIPWAGLEAPQCWGVPETSVRVRLRVVTSEIQGLPLLYMIPPGPFPLSPTMCPPSHTKP